MSDSQTMPPFLAAILKMAKINPDDIHRQMNNVAGEYKMTKDFLVTEIKSVQIMQTRIEKKLNLLLQERNIKYEEEVCSIENRNVN